MTGKHPGKTNVRTECFLITYRLVGLCPTLVASVSCHHHPGLDFRHTSDDATYGYQFSYGVRPHLPDHTRLIAAGTLEIQLTKGGGGRELSVRSWTAELSTPSPPPASTHNLRMSSAGYWFWGLRAAPGSRLRCSIINRCSM